MSWYLDPVPLLLHAVGAAVLALLGVLAARQVAGGDHRRAVERGWVLGPAAVALGALVLTGYRAATAEATDQAVPLATDEGLALEQVGAASPFLVSVVAPVLVLVWAVAASRRRDDRGSAPTAPALPGPGVAVQALGVWVVTLPLQAALCAADPSVPVVLLGVVTALAGTALAARPGSASTTGRDVGDVLVAVGVWVVTAAAWPGGWAYASPVVVVVLVLVRRAHRSATG